MSIDFQEDWLERVVGVHWRDKIPFKYFDYIGTATLVDVHGHQTSAGAPDTFYTGRDKGLFVPSLDTYQIELDGLSTTITITGKTFNVSGVGTPLAVPGLDSPAMDFIVFDQEQAELFVPPCTIIGDVPAGVHVHCPAGSGVAFVRVPSYFILLLGTNYAWGYASSWSTDQFIGDGGVLLRMQCDGFRLNLKTGSVDTLFTTPMADSEFYESVATTTPRKRP